MAITITVTPTDGENKFAITPQSFDGPLGGTNSSDLNLPGTGTKRYGSEFNTNLYRLLESFSCPEKTFTIAGIPSSNEIAVSGDLTGVFEGNNTVQIVNSSNNDGTYDIEGVVYYTVTDTEYPDQTVITISTDVLDGTTIDGEVGYPGWPQTEHSLGRGNGINYPVMGQVWFNTTTSTLLIFDGQKWKYVNNSEVGEQQPNKVPESGDLWYDTANNQLKVYDESVSSWLSVAHQYLRLDGTEPMQGSLDMGGYVITNASNPSSAQDVATKDYVDTQLSQNDELAENTDVTITDVTDNEALVYDNATGTWINKTLSEMNLYDQDQIDSNFYDKTEADGRFVNASGDSMSGNLDVNGNVVSFNALWLNEGNGNVSSAPDIRASHQMLIAADSSVQVHVDGTDDNSGYFRVSKGSLANDGSEIPLFSVHNNGIIKTEVVDYSSLVNDDVDIINKGYLDTAVSSPAFLSSPITLISTSYYTGWNTYDLSSWLPSNATHAILDYRSSMNKPDGGDVRAHIYVRRNSTEPTLILNRGESSGGGDSVSWGGQGIFPVTLLSRKIQIQIDYPGYNHGVIVRLVGYFS